MENATKESLWKIYRKSIKIFGNLWTCMEMYKNVRKIDGNVLKIYGTGWKCMENLWKYIRTSVLLCIDMHRVSGTNCVVDAIVKLIWAKVGITKAITLSITKAIQKLS